MRQQRYLRASKPELVERLLHAEQAYVDMENRWIRTADELLLWMMIVDKLIASRIHIDKPSAVGR